MSGHDQGEKAAGVQLENSESDAFLFGAKPKLRIRPKEEFVDSESDGSVSHDDARGASQQVKQFANSHNHEVPKPAC
jgi:hypothetical protein